MGGGLSATPLCLFLGVSILVLLDDVKERVVAVQDEGRVEMFQSLFYWMMLKNLTLLLLVVEQLGSFNPCFIG